MNKKDGGPAFPSSIIDDSLHVEGMTLRDYFAAKAMAALLSGDTFDFATFKDDPLRVARWAYDAADGMLKAREE